MKRITAYLIMVGLGLFTIACGSEPVTSGPSSLPTPSPNRPSEADLTLRLAGEMGNDTSRYTRDRNTIIGYALEHLLDVHAAPSGLYYEVFNEGEGEKLQWDDYISAQYIGYFLDGRVFANTYQRNEPFKFYLGNMIPAWREGLTMLAPGGKIRLLAPSDLGYGAEGLNTSKGIVLIPPHEVLAFEVEVLERLPR